MSFDVENYGDYSTVPQQSNPLFRVSGEGDNLSNTTWNSGINPTGYLGGGEGETYGWGFPGITNTIPAPANNGATPTAWGSAWGSSDDWNKNVGANSNIGKAGASGGGATAIGSPVPQTFDWNRIKAPVWEGVGPYNKPGYDEGKVKKYSQQYAAPYLAELRRAIRNAITRAGVTGNPIVQKYASEGAIASGGEKMGDVLSRSMREGRQIYGDEYKGELASSQFAYQSAYQNALQKFQSEVGQYNRDLEGMYKAGAVPNINSIYRNQ
jgi:hypothetical protein